MSTDSDDINEGELLQLALAAIAEVKLINTASKNLNAHRNTAKDDDDSEVVLFSISSGNEDSWKDPSYMAKERTPAAARRG